MIFLVCVTYCESAAQELSGAHVRMNEVQVVGSHNSYKREIQPALLELIKKENSKIASTLDYRHVSLAEQLTIGLRNLELDVVCDPEGGRFAHPYRNELLRLQGVTPLPYDTLDEMNAPGFKVMHIPDLDFRSWCPMLIDGLKQIYAWSVAHPRHVPIAITFNAKSDHLDAKGFTRLLPFTTAAFDSLDMELRSVFPRDRIITPDDVRGAYRTLNDAVCAGNWPLLDSARGKVLFVLDEQGEKQQTYLDGHPSLTGRAMFINALPGSAASAFVIVNDPVRFRDSITVLVKHGYLVRTRADADTREARLNDYTRMNAAIASGAQVITTDYYRAESRLTTGYHVTLPGGTMVRSNPVLLPVAAAPTISE